MVMGLNDSIRMGDRTIHVQTELHDLTGKVIETVCYDGGTIVDAYKSSYADLEPGDHYQQALEQRLRDQHLMIINKWKDTRSNDDPSNWRRLGVDEIEKILRDYFKENRK